MAITLNDFKRIKLPLNIIKFVRTSSFNTVKTTAGPGNEAVDLVDWINDAIELNLIDTTLGNGGSSNLSLGVVDSETVQIDIDTGTSAVIPSATTDEAGVMTAADKIKLNSLSNYAPPDHIGDVTSDGDGETEIQPNVVTNAKLANMAANTVKVRNVNTTGDPVDMTVATNKLVGRGSGDIQAISLGAGFSIDSGVLNYTESGSGGGSGDYNYNVPITSGNTGSNLEVNCTDTDVTAEWISASNRLEITIPVGQTLRSVDWKIVAADIQATADGGGATNWVQVKFINTPANTSITNLRIPALQKTNIPSSGNLSVSNAASVDIDNNPLMSAVGVSTNTITLRIQGLSVGSQGYHLKLTNI